jgi:alpha-tubulin suppressor-like RCC1 family protein
MKKRVSLNIFVILMTALLLFNGSAWAVPAPVTASIGDIATGFTVSAPIPITDVTVITHAIATGGFHSLAIRRDGTLWAWGFNWLGQLGDGTTTDRHRPVQVLTDVVSVAAGWEHSLAIRRDGTLWAWGRNEFGQLGDGTTTDRHRPVQVLTDVVSVAAGSAYSLATIPPP